MLSLASDEGTPALEDILGFQDPVSVVPSAGVFGVHHGYFFVSLSMVTSSYIKSSPLSLVLYAHGSASIFSICPTFLPHLS
jgi:hypothetical protein